MKKIIWILLLAGSFFSTTGCKKVESNDNGLVASIGPEAPYILPVGVRSCKAFATGSNTADVSPGSVEFTTFKYKWKGAGTYTMSAIMFEFKNPLIGNYKCTISGDELLYVLPAGKRTVEAADQPEEYVARCSIACGGIKVNSGVTSAQIPGRMKIIGIETDDSGDSRPISFEGDVALTYDD